MNEREILYHVLPDDRHTHHSKELVSVGTIIRAGGEPRLCGAFPHACKCAIDALQYAHGAIIFEGVILRGNVVHGDNKSCANERETVWMLTPEQTLNVLRRWALWCAEQALEHERAAGREPDPRSLRAIEVAQKYLDGEATLEELKSAATGAAYTADAIYVIYATYAVYTADATYAALAAADYATYAAADYAALAAADAADAADTAARAAAYAAADAARTAQNKELERLIALELEEINA